MKLINLWLQSEYMGLWKANLDGSSIHLAVEGSCGGSSLGIQLARQAIEDGGRVLWASPELPDGTRFSQIFEGLNLTASSRFHAMNLVGEVGQSLKALSDAAKMLPGVSLVVLDDYCPDTGKMPGDVIEAVNKLISDSQWTTLLISKGGESMDDRPLVARGEKSLSTNQTWYLTRQSTDSKRQLWVDEKPIQLRLDESGFME